MNMIYDIRPFGYVGSNTYYKPTTMDELECIEFKESVKFNTDLSNEDRQLLLEAVDIMNSDELVLTEGANTKALGVMRKHSKDIKANLKKVKQAVKRKDYDTAKKVLEEIESDNAAMKKETHKVYSEYEGMVGGKGDTVTKMIAGQILNTISLSVSIAIAIVAFNFAVLGVSAQTLKVEIAAAKAFIGAYKLLFVAVRRKSVKFSDFNPVIAAADDFHSSVDRIISKLRKEISNQEDEAKEKDTKESVEIEETDVEILKEICESCDDLSQEDRKILLESLTDFCFNSDDDVLTEGAIKEFFKNRRLEKISVNKVNIRKALINVLKCARHKNYDEAGAHVDEAKKALAEYKKEFEELKKELKSGTLLNEQKDIFYKTCRKIYPHDILVILKKINKKLKAGLDPEIKRLASVMSEINYITGSNTSISYGTSSSGHVSSYVTSTRRPINLGAMLNAFNISIGLIETSLNKLSDALGKNVKESVEDVKKAQEIKKEAEDADNEVMPSTPTGHAKSETESSATTIGKMKATPGNVEETVDVSHNGSDTRASMDDSVSQINKTQINTKSLDNDKTGDHLQGLLAMATKGASLFMGGSSSSSSSSSSATESVDPEAIKNAATTNDDAIAKLNDHACDIILKCDQVVQQEFMEKLKESEDGIRMDAVMDAYNTALDIYKKRCFTAEAKLLGVDTDTAKIGKDAIKHMLVDTRALNQAKAGMSEEEQKLLDAMILALDKEYKHKVATSKEEIKLEATELVYEAALSTLIDKIKKLIEKRRARRKEIKERIKKIKEMTKKSENSKKSYVALVKESLDVDWDAELQDTADDVLNDDEAMFKDYIGQIKASIAGGRTDEAIKAAKQMQSFCYELKMNYIVDFNIDDDNKSDPGIKMYNKYQAEFDKLLGEAKKSASKVKTESTEEAEEVVEELAIAEMDEAADIDPSIKDDIATLNRKGYKTKYSSGGHAHLNKKSDVDDNGVYYGKLYSDARVQFNGHFKMPAAPDGWTWRDVDGDDYLDIIPKTYNDKDGSTSEAFEKWKKEYLASLHKWVEALPDVKDAKGEPTKEEVKEAAMAVDRELETMLESVMADLEYDLNIF